MKALSIVGIVLFGLGLISSTDNSSYSSLEGWCGLVCLFGIALAIATLHYVRANRKLKNEELGVQAKKV